MVRPTARVLSLLELLQSGGVRTVASLAERLQVDERTVRRYAEHLIDLDVPIESVRGRYGGYRLGRGHRLPPLMLSDDEALAVLWSLTVTGRTLAAETAGAKLRRVLPDRLARRLDALLATVVSTDTTPAPEVPDAGTLLPLAAAVREHQPVRLTYTSGDGRRGERTLHPYGLVVHRDRWYVTGLDPAAGDRTLRLDRIEDVRALPGSFTPPDGVDPAEGLVTAFATAPYRYRVRLRVDATPEHVRRRLPASVAVLSEGPGWLGVEMRVESLDWVPAVLAGLDRPFTIDEPAELRERVAAFAARLGESAARRPGD